MKKGVSDCCNVKSAFSLVDKVIEISNLELVKDLAVVIEFIKI